MKLCEYFDEWVDTYKVGAIKPVTLNKYRNAGKFLRSNFPTLEVGELNKRTYQGIINKYSETHHRQTTTDFNTIVKACVLDAIDEGLIAINPTRNITIKAGNPQKQRKADKYLNQEDAKKLVAALDLTTPIAVNKSGKTVINWDWLILLLLKTGLRFSEAVGLTPRDFDCSADTISVSKTFDYKVTQSLVDETKTKTSARKVAIDATTTARFKAAMAGTPDNQPIFAPGGHRVFSSTPNYRLSRLCTLTGIPQISLHGLRHTHGSLLLYAGVSVHSISRRLGHSKVSITQDVYLHTIKELEDKDNDTITACMASY